MSTQKKQKLTTTNKQLMERLRRLQIVTTWSVPEFIAYVALLLVNRGKPIKLDRAVMMINTYALDDKIIKNTPIPTNNVLEALIVLVIYKRDLLQSFFEDKELEVWNDETTAPIFDIMYEISRIYKI